MIGLYGSYTASFISYLGVAKFKPQCDPYAVVPAKNDVIDNGTGTGTGNETKTDTGAESKTDTETSTNTEGEMQNADTGKVKSH